MGAWFHEFLSDSNNLYTLHHHFLLLARISLTLCRSSSPSFIGRSSRLHPVSVQSNCRQVLAGHPTFARPCERVHRSKSLEFILTYQTVSCMSCSANLDGFRDGQLEALHLLFVGSCLQDLFYIARSILVQLSSNFFSMCIVNVHLMHQYRSIDTTAACVLFYRSGLTSK